MPHTQKSISGNIKTCVKNNKSLKLLEETKTYVYNP